MPDNSIETYNTKKLHNNPFKTLYTVGILNFTLKIYYKSLGIYYNAFVKHENIFEKHDST